MTDELKRLETEALTIPERARALKIVDAGTYQEAGALLVAIKGFRKQVAAACDPLIESTNKAHKDAVAQKRKFEEHLIRAESIVKPMMAAWDTAQEQIRVAEEARLRELARKQEEDRQLADAAALEQAGDKAGAEAVLSEPVQAPPVILAKSVPKVPGVSYTERWTFRVVKPDAIPRAYLIPDLVKIGAVVRALKGATLIPGIEAYSEKGVSARG